jgi:outer membrane protein
MDLAHLRPVVSAGACAVVGCLLWPVTSARAATPVAVGGQALPAQAAEPSAESSEASRRWEGAIGVVVTNRPEFAGAADRSTGLRPAGFLRWGRFTLASSGGFSTARRDAVDGGLGARLGGGSGALRWSVGLRRESGRGETESVDLLGMGSIPSTIQGRVSARWNPAPRWQVRGLVAFDVLGKVPGSEADLTLTHTWPLGPESSWSTTAGVGFGSRSFNRTWHGVTAEQSARSGKPVYEPGAGVRGVRIGGTWRAAFGPRWAGFVGLGYSREVGLAADSPLSAEDGGATASAGLVWRF